MSDGRRDMQPPSASELRQQVRILESKLERQRDAIVNQLRAILDKYRPAENATDDEEAHANRAAIESIENWVKTNMSGAQTEEEK